MSEPLSEGTCHLCNGIFKKGVMTRHLKKCTGPGAPPAFPTAGEERPGPSFHLLVEGRYDTGYWLHLAVPAEATLTGLDQFLREIWLECCGHMSCFTIGGNRYSRSPMAELHERGTSVRLHRVLEAGLKFSYEYDYGSTTELRLKVVGLREQGTPGGKVQLLARNEQPRGMCRRCKQQLATQICVACDCSGRWLCEACAGEHECGEEMMLPVVNSPRAGVCGYCG